MREVDLLLLVAPFIHGEIDNPAELELVLVDQTQIEPDLVTRRARELVEGVWITADKECRVADLQTQLLTNGFGPLRADILGDRTGSALFTFTPEDIAQTGLPLALGPIIHAVTEGAATTARRGNSPDRRFWIFQHSGKDLKARTPERL